MPARRKESQTADPATVPASPSSAKMPAPTIAPMPRKAAPRTVMSGVGGIGVWSPKNSQTMRMPTSAVTIHATCSGSWNEWSMTRLPRLVVPVVSASAAAICVPLAGSKRTPTTAVHMAIM